MNAEEPPSFSDKCFKGYILDYSDLKFDEVIGTGAEGEVSIGKYIPTNQMVAIKRLHDNGIIENDHIFRREVYSLSVLRHPFILPFVGFTDKPPFCIVTKYISSGSLFKVLRMVPMPLTGTDLSLIAYGVALAMKYLHEQKFIHRDLKTHNILIDERKLPVICDFGSTREMDQVMTGQCGTPNYMAPEFIRNESYDQSVDVYSYGMILWEMITKEIPYARKEPPQVVYMIISNKQPEIPDNTTDALRKLILSCWDREPAKRPTFTEIVKIFEKGTPLFQGSDIDQYKQALHNFADGRTTRQATSKSTSLQVSEISHLIPSSIPDKLKKYDHEMKRNIPIRAHITQLANSYIGGISTGTDQQIRKSIQFFMTAASDPLLAQIELWPKLLPVLVNTKPSLLPEMQKLVIKLAQYPHILASIALVDDLHRFVRPETYDLFLYVVTFVPQAITKNLVQAIKKHAKRDINTTSPFSNVSFNISDLIFDSDDNDPSKNEISPDHTSSSKRLSMQSSVKMISEVEKPIILLCKILNGTHNDPSIDEDIIDFFTVIAPYYANMGGGNLILRTLMNFNRITEELLGLYANSCIIENSIAAYECSFTQTSIPASMLTLQQILGNMVNQESEELRRCSLEYILRFGKNASGQPLINLIEALISLIIQYGPSLSGLIIDEDECTCTPQKESSAEYAILVLCRIAEDKNQSAILLKPFVSNIWMQLSPLKAPIFLPVFVQLIESEPNRKIIRATNDSAVFLASSMKTGDKKSIRAIHYCLNKIEVNFAYAKLLEENNFNDIVAERLQNTKNITISQYISKIICVLSKFIYSKSFLTEVPLLLKIISARSQSSDDALNALACISYHQDSHSVFIDQNALSVLSKYEKKEESSKQIKLILSNLKVSGRYNIP